MAASEVIQAAGSTYRNSQKQQEDGPTVYYDSFTWIVVSDTQLPRALDGNGTECAYCNRSQSEQKNREHVSSMNTIIREKGAKFVIINGDLTEYGHDDEFEEYKGIYSRVNAPIRPGLGNHDYANNVDDCELNNCATRMVEFIRRLESTDMKCRTHRVKTCVGSLMYSWRDNGLAFIQLHNYPTYQRNISAPLIVYYITPSLNQLKTLLDKLKISGNPSVVLNLHDPNEHWGEGDRELFENLINSYNVAVVFAGHFHTVHGRYGSYGDIPLFLSGSAIYNTYLVVEADHTNNKLTVNRYSSVAGNAKFLGSDVVPLHRVFSKATPN
ncbi:hypothetical protein RclHR1_18000010 [Rhizophagus clarus]|uniref:Phosphoesterase n=1 Tax=Rhizophagus clarus TaxID=94130 RepID=A0A2Z6R029_9GLOM|nr:hypothetical protein RclHR1_18000010 [Rhizophagus clarus]GES79024.1 phosphoesterase [Rhizophagus clarus]